MLKTGITLELVVHQNKVINTMQQCGVAMINLFPDTQKPEFYGWFGRFYNNKFLEELEIAKVWVNTIM